MAASSLSRMGEYYHTSLATTFHWTMGPGRLRLILLHSDKARLEKGTPLVVPAKAGTQKLRPLRAVCYCADPLVSRLRENDERQQVNH